LNVVTLARMSQSDAIVFVIGSTVFYGRGISAERTPLGETGRPVGYLKGFLVWMFMLVPVVVCVGIILLAALLREQPWK